MSTYFDDRAVHNAGNSRRAPAENGHTLNAHLNSFLSGPSGNSPRLSREALMSALGDFDSPLAQQLLAQLQQEQDKGSPLNGMSREYLDSLDRVPKSKLKSSDSCAICSVPYLDDKYPLVVRLPCNSLHHFDLECIAPWLEMHTTCPLCRKDLKKPAQPPVEDDDDEEEYDDMYA